MPLRGLRRLDTLAGRPPRRRPWRIRLAGLISLLIHVALGVLLFVTIRGERSPELLPPPSAVTMLFETGKKTGPTLPNPELQATPSAPPEPSPAVKIPLPPQPPPPIPAPVEPPAPSPPAPTPVAPPAAPPPLSAPVEPPVPPPPEPVPPERPAPPIEALPPSPPAERAPLPPPPPPAKRSLASKPPPVRSRPGQAAAPKPSGFSAPMNLSFGAPSRLSPSPARPRSATHIPGTIDMSLGPASRGAADPTPLSEHDEDAAGADWVNALSRWVSEHAYYPEQARREFEEGDAKVRVLADPDGRVKEVELIGKSGSMWLDMALLSLFRDQHIPPLPSGDHDPIDFNFTMHYVLVRSP
jgi:protein TonB